MFRAWGLHNLITTSTTLSCSAITSMTRHHCHQYESTFTSCHGQVASAAPSPALLDSTVVGMTLHLHRTTTKSPRQRHCQHDSIYTLRYDHVAPVVPSPAWVDSTITVWLIIYITPRPSSLDSAITSMTWQHYCQHDSISTSHRSKVASAISSPA
jgi:hypothetical protein